MAEIGNSNDFFAQNQVFSKKKKRSSPKLRVIFRPDSLRVGWWGGDASRNGAELFELEADFSAKIVTFRLVGGDASPPSPPLNPPLVTSKVCSTVRYVTPQFLRRGTVRWYGTFFLRWYGYGTLVRYVFFVMVRVRYVGTLFELKIPDFLLIAPAFCKQR